jgi:hypothetical protein
MTSRQLDFSQIRLSSDHDIMVHSHVKNIQSLSGQAAGLRFFDSDSREDFESVSAIFKGKQSRKWMDDVVRITYSDYREWVNNYTPRSFLFSVHDVREPSPEKINQTRGLVNFYLERGEIYRLKKMDKLGFIDYDPQKTYLEVSFALKPSVDGVQVGSGLMSSSVRSGSLFIKAMLNYPKLSNLVIFGFVDPENAPAHRTLASAGFIKKGSMPYDSSSAEVSDLYILSWRHLHKKVVNL